MRRPRRSVGASPWILTTLAGVAFLIASACGFRQGGNGDLGSRLAARLAETATPITQPTAQPEQAFTGEAPSGPPDVQGDVQTTASGLQYIDEQVGTGPTPQARQTVSVHYTGWLTNGLKFDSSRDRNLPFNFQLGTGKVIPGWDEGIATMHVGGKRRLIVPPDLAYGVTGNGPIPPNATILFDVELLSASS